MMLTGRKVFLIFASAFAVIIGVNVLLAVKAVSTFPGLEVENSYVASQTFDAEKAAQEALGWRTAVAYAGGDLSISITGRDGQPVQPATLTATVGRATERNEDSTPAFAWQGGSYRAPVQLGRGYWNVWLEAHAADGTLFRQRLELRVAG
jgi:nitrogen fixation protein FixH